MLTKQDILETGTQIINNEGASIAQKMLDDCESFLERHAVELTLCGRLKWDVSVYADREKSWNHIPFAAVKPVLDKLGEMGFEADFIPAAINSKESDYIYIR